MDKLTIWFDFPDRKPIINELERLSFELENEGFFDWKLGLLCTQEQYIKLLQEINSLFIFRRREKVSRICGFEVKIIREIE